MAYMQTCAVWYQPISELANLVVCSYGDQGRYMERFCGRVATHEENASE